MTKPRHAKQSTSKEKMPVHNDMLGRYRFIHLVRENEIADLTGSLVNRSDSTLTRLIERIKSL